MLARAGNLPPPREQDRWSYEIKWDGVRAIGYVQPGRFRLESRNLREITDAYPEVRGILRDLGMHEAVLDGEIVAFDEDGRPSFSRLQQRMHVTSPSAVKRLMGSTPVVYAIFDLLYLDGHSLMGLPYRERRARLEALELGGPAWRVPAAHGGDGEKLLQATEAQGLEGVVAKRGDSTYDPGRRTGAWIKVKNTSRQELVIGGWIPGEGRRKRRIGALLMGYWENGEFVYAGRVGTGFTEKTLDMLAERLAPLERDASPFTASRRSSQGGGVRRAAAGRRDRDPRVDAGSDHARAVVQGPAGGQGAPRRSTRRADRRHRAGGRPEALFEEVERLPDGALAVVADGRRLKISNWDKVLFPKTGFTKGDLITFYARIAPVVVPHLRDRPLTLKRYPNGVEAPYFYEKQSPSHRPEWVETARIGGIDYTLVQDRPTLIWLANLADVELHTSLALAADPQRPTMLVFDLDPGPPAGLVECCEVGLVLHGLFKQLGLESVIKTSGSKGMQMYVPLNAETNYEQTKPFARRVAEVLEQRMPQLVVSRMTKRLRPGKVFVDWSQNDDHKTTVSVYSVRARERPTVSTPVRWEEVRRGAASRPVPSCSRSIPRTSFSGSTSSAICSRHCSASRRSFPRCERHLI